MLCSVLALAQQPAQQVHLRFLLYLLHLHCNSRQKSPTPCFARHGSPLRSLAPSRLAAVTPYRANLLPCRAPSPPRPLRLVAPCPIPCRVEVLSTMPFPTRRSWPLSTPAPSHLSTLARDITRYGVARPEALALPSFLGCCKHVLQGYASSVSGVSYACYKCFMWMLQK